VAKHLSTNLSFLPTLQLQGCGLTFQVFSSILVAGFNCHAKSESVDAPEVATSSEADAGEARLNINCPEPHSISVHITAVHRTPKHKHSVERTQQYHNKSIIFIMIW